MSENLPSIEANVRISLANSGKNLSPADVGATAALLRLSRLIDTMLDVGETKDLAALYSRLNSLMDSLHLTPKARNDATVQPKELDNGDEFQQAYLRIVGTPNPVKKAAGQKPRANSGGTSRKPK